MLSTSIFVLVSALGHCPCASISRINTSRDDSGRKVCVVLPPGELTSDVAKIKDILTTTSAETYRKVVFIDEAGAQSPACLASLHVVTSISIEDWSKKRWLCPDSCTPVPKAAVPLEILTLDPQQASLSKYLNVALSCSVHVLDALEQFKQHTSTNTAKHLIWSHYLLHTLANRIVLECLEHWNVLHQEYRVTIQDDLAQPTSTSNLISYVLPRRKVQAVVIWIGNAERYSRILNQHEALREASFHDHQAVIGWGATDTLYGCKEESTKCIGDNKRFAGLLPKSDVNFMPPGWGCAQRRPLRALSHVLSLFDPQYIVVLDDDTFLNFPLLRSKYASMIAQNLSIESSYMGEAMGRTGDKGHISKVGFFVGGSGYILGRNIIQRLVNREVALFGFEFELHKDPKASFQALAKDIAEDESRSQHQIWHLSLVADALRTSLSLCPKPIDGMDERLKEISQCVLNLENAKDKELVSIGVRLIDFCVNMMANDNTCQHR
ncbi:hypothetical protein EON65_06240 [archaeon]|nr:MAG: hypothetical protein EON65_06240 [archaeon]